MEPRISNASSSPAELAGEILFGTRAALVLRGLGVVLAGGGAGAANARHRRYADGCSSYDKVIAAIGLLRSRFLDLYGGLLCTIDVANDPVAVYESLMELG